MAGNYTWAKAAGMQTAITAITVMAERYRGSGEQRRPAVSIKTYHLYNAATKERRRFYFLAAAPRCLQLCNSNKCPELPYVWHSTTADRSVISFLFDYLILSYHGARISAPARPGPPLFMYFVFGFFVFEVHRNHVTEWMALFSAVRVL